MNKTIARNSLLMLLGQTLGRLLRAGIIIYAARVLGAGNWGALENALSISAFFVIFADLGINSLLIRESNKKPEEQKTYLATSLLIKITLVAVLALLMNLFAGKLSHLPGAVALMPIVALVFIFDSLRDLGTALSRAIEKMEIEAAANVITNLFIVVLGFVALRHFGTNQSFAIAYAIGAGLGAVAVFIPLRGYFQKIWKHVDKRLIKSIIFSAWPFGLVSLLGIVMINTDVMILGLMSTAEQVGFYSAAQKPIQFIYIIPSLLSAAFLPSLSRLAGKEEKISHFRDRIEQGVKATLFVAIPATIGGAILAKPIMLLLYGPAYLSGTTSFFILCLTFIAVFPSALIVNAAFAAGSQKEFVIYSFLGIFGNIVLDILLIPAFGIAGAALATLLNQVFVNAYVWRKMKQMTRFTILPHLQKIIPAGLLMGITCYAGLQSGLPVLINIAFSGGVYLGILWLFKENLFKKFTELELE
ncbi:MAG: flippase [Patescibacteria group bacterium]|nr:flippase [Patescibacteria group bacterium]MCL5261891.1 flippase [Patescibacteria group bacterium]